MGARITAIIFIKSIQINNEITYDDTAVMKRRLRPRCRTFERSGGNAPYSDVPGFTYRNTVLLHGVQFSCFFVCFVSYQCTLLRWAAVVLIFCSQDLLHR